MTDERSWLIRHLHTHPVHAANYPAGHDFVLVSTARIRDEHEHQHTIYGGSRAEVMTDDSTAAERNALRKTLRDLGYESGPKTWNATAILPEVYALAGRGLIGPVPGGSYLYQLTEAGRQLLRGEDVVTDEPDTLRNQPEDRENPVSDIHTRIFNGRPPADDDEGYSENEYFDRFTYRGNVAPDTVRALDTLTGKVVDIRITIVRTITQKGERT